MEWTTVYDFGNESLRVNPPRNEQQPAIIADLVYVVIEVGGLALVLFGIGKRLIELFSQGN